MTPPGWTRQPLSKFITLQRGMDLPTKKRRPGRFKVLSSGESHGWHDEGPVKGPGFAVGRATNLGRPTWSDEDYWPLNTTLYAKDFHGNDPKFAYFWFLGADLSTFNSGSVQPMLNRNYIANVPIDVPPVAEQRAIAATLGAFDDKIESNRRAIETGERLLRSKVLLAIDTSSGDEGVLSDYCGLVNATVKAGSIDPSANYIGLEHMPRGSVFLNAWSTAEGLGSHKTAFQAGDLLFGKLRPYFKKVGIAPVAGVCSTDILVIRPKNPRDLGLITCVGASDALIDSLSASSTGTRMPRASWNDLASWPVPKMTEAELVALADDVSPLIARLEALTFESKRLAALRDALLPELLSGSIRVPAEEASG